VNAAYYALHLHKLRDAIKEKRRGMLTRGVCLLHDNAPVHECELMKQTMHLPKPTNNTSSLIPYEQLYIQPLHQGTDSLTKPRRSKPRFKLSLTLTSPNLTNQLHSTILTVNTTYAAALKTTTHLQLGYVKFIKKFLTLISNLITSHTHCHKLI